ncbi:hypothetical protein CC85DRAFT_284819 [Cutaneotrichosporon oleaginosum]|uniref:Uncharacterized protein n=1 Tax=Cutaneotrichosporon oleaginosum TaxID=879819 RepID=A0A0J0XPN4_9TREE|nr:uncharacterized protein CC85DRAFT_284819 [Cutaneotrichosporon oleaginosum]KLT43063.1 hypothetical protein CC85DRAFT_284819 [Cutaneotrichosporon oleaginosum]TXT09995.1 hypothetical protein COLE_03929 [Cutaneotrichosporon oleaginosum]
MWPWLLALALPALACVPNSTAQADIQALLAAGGRGYTLSLCPGQVYDVAGPLNFTAAEQEISTEGYPTGEARAVLRVVSGMCAVRGNGAGLDGVRLRHVQVDGNRVGNAGAPGSNEGNIEVGGSNRGQVVEWVRSFNPRGWTCLHVVEGELACANATIQHNDIGPCGHDTWADWADGISLSCANSTVYNNTIVDATDGGIVIFGAPYSTVSANRVRASTRVMLGGINLVDMLPWKPDGNYSGTRVVSNFIEGGYASAAGNASRGPNAARALIKIGIGVGPKVWWAETYQNTSRGGEVSNNVLSGAFSFGVAVGGVQNFRITNNSFVGNATFIGSYGANCTQWDKTPNPPTALLREPDSLVNVEIAKRDDYGWTDGRVQGLTCFVPPPANEWAWPYGGGGFNADPTTSASTPPTPTPSEVKAQDSAATRFVPATCLTLIAAAMAALV